MKEFWRRFPDSKLLLEELGACTAVFCVHTGDTHIIDAFPAAVLDVLSSHHRTSTEQVSCALAAGVSEPVEEWRPRVRKVLASLELMQLVESDEP